MTIEFKNRLEGERITLERTKPTLRTAEVIFDLVDKNREHLDPWFPWPRLTLKVEDSLKYLFDKEEETKKGNKIEYGLYLNEKYIGNIGLFDINEKKKSAEIGYWLSLAHTKNGYMAEAVGLLEKEAFQEMGLNRVQIRCDEENKASLHVAKRCNYQYEGRLREDSFNEYQNNFRNTFVFSKLSSEYKER